MNNYQDAKQRDSRPFAGTILFALACGLAFIPIFEIAAFFIGGYLAFRLVLWAYLAAYCLLLFRWSGVFSIQSVFPLALLLVLIPAGLSRFSFLAAALMTLAWIRTGICFPRPVMGGLISEAMLIFAGTLPALMFVPWSSFSWAVAAWLFFVIQSLYFVLRPGLVSGNYAPGMGAFEQARHKAQRILTE